MIKSRKSNYSKGIDFPVVIEDLEVNEYKKILEEEVVEDNDITGFDQFQQMLFGKAGK